MQYYTIEPKMLCGTVAVPPSKSMAHRALIAAALSGSICKVRNVAFSEDISATLACLKAMGASFRISRVRNEVCFAPPKDRKPPEDFHLPCGESGSTLRFLMPLALVLGNKATLTGKGRLMQRPQKPYMDLFTQKGIRWSSFENEIHLQGELKPGLYRIPGNVSSQFISGLLFALPLLHGDSEIRVTTLMESKGYVDLTLSVLKQFGITVQNENNRRFIIYGNQKYRPVDYTVEGDYSQAAFFLAAGALGCDVSCTGLNPESLQGDRKILEIIRETGAEVIETEDGTVSAKYRPGMHGIDIDAREIPDLVPILAVLCSLCKGRSRILNAGRLRMKESDRLAAISRELNQLGAVVREETDSLVIDGKQVLGGSTVSAWGDHRIAMALAIAACRCEGEVSISGAIEAVKKSYPDFWEVYENLRKTGPVPVIEYGEHITES